MKKIVLIVICFLAIQLEAQVNFTLTPNSGCIPLDVTADVNGNNPSFEYYYWDFGDGFTDWGSNSTLNHIYTQNGSYTVYLEVYDINFNFIGSQTDVVTVDGSGVMASVTTSNLGDQIDFFSTGDATSISWDFGDGVGTSNQLNPSYTYSTLGTFTVTATIVSPTCGTFDQIITINVVDYGFTATPMSGCAPLDVNFSFNGNDPNIAYYYWDFGDGGSDWGSNVSINHTYSQTGNLTAFLYLYDVNFNIISSSSQVISVSGSGVVSSVIGANVGDQIDFFSTGDATSISWDFGDGIGTSNQLNPSYTYSSLGTYTVTATVVSPSCGTFNQTITITIADYSFTSNPTSGCVPLDVDFTFNGNDPNIAYLYWDFGDGGSDWGSNTSITYTYTQIGSFNAYLELYDVNFNIISSSSQVITVNGQTISSSSSFASIGETINFNSAGTFTSVLWDFGDGNTSSSNNPSHVYASTGVYNVTATFQSASCGTSVQTLVINVGDFSFTATPTTGNCAPLNVDFTFTGSLTGVDYLYWDFGDFNSDFGLNTNVSNSYQSVGTFTCTLYLYDLNFNIIGSSSQVITINGPTASASTYLTDVGNSINFNVSGTVTSVNWDFGDGNTSNQINPSHSYAATGTYFVTATIVSPSCGTMVQYLTIQISDITFSASATSGCAPLTTTFTYTGSNPNAYYFEWDSGDGNYEYDVNQTFTTTYMANGTYYPYLYVYDVNSNYLGYAQLTITISNNQTTPTISASGPTSFCNGGSVTLTSSSATNNVWSTGETTQAITVSTAGTYNVTAGTGACTATSLDETITITNPPVISLGTVVAPSVCNALDASIQINGSGTGDVSWTGTSSGSLTGVTLPITITGLGAGTYNIDFSNPCLSNTLTTTITNPGAPAIPTITASGATTFCAGGSVNLTSSSANNNIWSTGETTQTITVNSTGNYNVAVSSGGCSSTSLNKTVTVNPLPATPTITTSGTTTFCAGNNVVLTSSSASNNHWSNGATTQSITVINSGNFSVFVQTNGCSSSSSLVETVTVNPLPTLPSVAADGPLNFCIGDDVVLTSSYTSGNLWSTGETTQSITVNTSGTYNVTVSNAFCSRTSTDKVINVNSTPPAQPTITSNNGTNTVCQGSTIILTSSSSSNNTWSNGATTNSISVSSGGDYSVSVNIGGCIANSNPTTITVNPNPAVPTITASGATTFCSGSSITLTASTPNNITWSTGATTQSITVSNSGSFTVTADLLGCTKTSSAKVITVNQTPQVPLILVDGSFTFCNGGSVNLSTTASSNFTWSTGETTPSILVSSTQSISVTESVNGCSSQSLQVNITEFANPVVTLAPLNDVCNTSPSFVLTNGSPSGGNYAINGLDNNLFNPATSFIGANAISYTFIDGNGCQGTAFNTININNCLNVEQDGQEEFVLYPNPTSSIINFKGDMLDLISHVELRDELGRLVRTYDLNEVKNPIYLGDFDNGIYTFTIKGIDFEQIKKVQVIK